MSVRSALNIDSLLAAADESWPRWTQPEPLVAAFSSSQELMQWRPTAGWQEDREVLLALGRLVLREDSRLEATAVMVAVVLPVCESVVSLRCRSATDSRHVRQVAAGYVWSEVARYPWDAPLRGWIPQAIARRVGRGLDREFGWGQSAERVWRERAVLEPEVMERVTPADRGEPLESSRLYWWALTEARLPREDLDLLMALAVAASEDGATARGSAGLMARSVCQRVAGPGRSVDQVQHRAMKALRHLRAVARPAA